MSTHTGIARVLREDLPHAAGGASIALLCHVLGALDPIGVGLATLFGFGRELWQMTVDRDASFGPSRVRDALGWVVGAILIAVTVRVYGL